MFTNNFTNHWKLYNYSFALGETTTDAVSYSFTNTNGTTSTKTSQPNNNSGVLYYSSAFFRPPISFKFRRNNVAQNSNSYFSYMGTATTSIGNADIIVGSGTTAPTVDDTVLENQITTLTFVSCTQEINTEENFVGIYKTLYNGTGADITINEIGILGSIGNDNYPFLLYRDVFSEPLIVKNNETIRLGIKISL